MSNYNHNNANINIVQMIQQLQQWNKKPSLNDRMSDFLELFHNYINSERINFAEAGLFLQESSVLNCKQVDLLYKGFLECHKNLSDVYNEKKKEEELKQKEMNNLEANKPDETVKELEKPKKDKKKKELKKPDEPESVVREEEITDLINPALPEKFSIPGIPDEILVKLKLSDCLPGGPIDEFIDKLDKNHPLYSIISKLGKEISQNKDIFTYNNLSLSGLSWNALFKIEEVLSRINPTRNDNETQENFEQCQQTQTDEDSGIDTEHFTTIQETSVINLEQSVSNLDETALTCTTLENPSQPAQSDQTAPHTSLENPQPDQSAQTTPPVKLTEEQKQHIRKECLEKVVKINLFKLTEELKHHIRKECVENEIKINLLKFDFKLLKKKFHFRLPVEYFKERKSERLKKRKNEEEGSDKPVKRKKNDDTDTHKPKSFDLELFDNFCYNYYESQGISIPRPQTIDANRKSIDNRSEVSFGNPLTPADSGRFSLSFATDSEFDHCDADAEDNCRDNGLPFSRADSGIEVMGPFSPPSENGDSPESRSIEPPPNETLKTLRTLFPATFSDPERAEALKSLYKQPEDDERYMQWKKFIDEKTANDQEFNIHEYGTDILNSFSTHSTDKLSFKTIVNDKSVSDISKYFVSTLQLANTYNIEIVDKHPGEIRPDNIELKFLTDKRAHEEIDSHLNDISEEHFMDHLISNRSKTFQSTPLHPEPVAGPSHYKKSTKRKRLEYCY